jgi:NAD(P)H dehydrogenase (quinone)
MDKVFITTSSGNIGTELVKVLNKIGLEFTAGYNQKQPTEIKTVKQINFDNYESLVEAFAGHRTLYLLLPDNEKVIERAKSAIKAAQQAGIKHIVRSSGMNADSKSSYEILKIAGIIEDLVEESGLDYTFVRPNSFFQNFLTYHSYSIKSGGLYLPHGNGKVSYIDVKDVALSVATILSNPEKHSGKIYTLTGSAAHDTYEIVKIISGVVGKQINYVSIQDSDFVEAMKKHQLPQFDIDTMLSLYQSDRAGLHATITDTVKQLTGREPNTFETFINDNKALLT